MRLHGTKRAILILHSACGAYNGLGAREDSSAEAENHRRELRRAAANMRQAIPGIAISAYFVDFEGVWEAELDQSSTSAPS